MNFSITKQQEEHIREAVAGGDYANASEYVRQAIREKMERDRIREAKLRELRALIQEGIDSGPAVPFDIEAFFREADEEEAAEDLAAENLAVK